MRIHLIRICGEPSQAIIVQENPQRINRREQNIQPQVEFQAIQQKRLFQVFLHHKFFLPWILT